MQQQPAWSARLRLALERLAQLRGALRPHPGDVLDPSALDRLAQLRRRSRTERAPGRDGLLRRQTEVAPEPDESRLDLALQLARVRDLAGLDELAQPRLQARPDPAQVANLPAAHEVDNRRRQCADQL